MELEQNKLFHGDCLELMPFIADKSVDMILCDLPYGTTKCKWDTIIPFEPLWKQYERIIKPNGAIVLFGSQPFTSILIASNLVDYRYSWYWLKDKPSNFLMGKQQPLRYVEEINIFYKNTAFYNPQMEIRENKNKRVNNVNSSFTMLKHRGDENIKKSHQKRLESGNSDYIYPRNYQKFNNRTKGLHPCQKPLELMEYLVKTYTNEGDLVLDNCIGSGTTAIACINTNRSFIGIEKDENYFNIASQRIDEKRNENQNKLDI